MRLIMNLLPITQARYVFGLLLSVLAMNAMSQSYNNSVVGSHIYYESTGPKQFDIFYEVYIDGGNSSQPATLNLNFVDCGGTISSVFMTTTNASGTNISDVCGDSLGSTEFLGNGGAIEGRRKVVFTEVLIYPLLQFVIITSLEIKVFPEHPLRTLM